MFLLLAPNLFWGKKNTLVVLTSKHNIYCSVVFSYLHHKTIDTDSSSPESDSNDHPSVDTVRKKTQISNGFSDDSIIQSKIQNKNLKDLIDGLENEGGKSEDVGGAPAATNLEVVEANDVVMRMVQDFSLLSESESEDESKPEKAETVRNF